MLDIILIGGGGHCKSCIDVIEQENKYNIIGVVDLLENGGKEILGYPIIGSDQDLDNLSTSCDFFLLTLGQIKSTAVRIKLYNKIKSLNKIFPFIISPLAYVSKHPTINEGTIVMHGAIINADSSIGDNCIINTNAINEHDNHIGDYCHISTLTIVNGGVSIGDFCTIGSNSSIINNINITSNVIIGIGAVVINKDGIYVGIPAKRILS